MSLNEFIQLILKWQQFEKLVLVLVPRVVFFNIFNHIHSRKYIDKITRQNIRNIFVHKVKNHIIVSYLKAEFLFCRHFLNLLGMETSNLGFRLPNIY